MPQPPLARHELFRTADPDRARELVAQKFCNHRLDIVGERAAFRAVHNHAPGVMLSLNFIGYGADVLIDPGALDDFYLIQIPLRGAAIVRNGLREVTTDSRMASVLNPHWSTRMKWVGDCAQILLQLRRQPFHDFAEQFLGRRIANPIAFDPGVDFSRPEMAHWREDVMRLVNRSEAGPAPILSAALCEQQVMADFLRLQPHDMADFVAPTPREAIPRHLRRAVEFMRAHAQDPITLADLAAVAGVSGRTLQLAWKAAFGQTPTEALTQERLRRARYELRNAGPEISVADAARKWGFAHLGRFSAAYRAMFGEFPRETLARAR